MLPKEQILTELPNYYGTVAYHRWSGLFPYVMTDGAQFVAESCGAHWLMDLIASHQVHAKVRREPFQVWELKVTGSKAVAICEDGNDHIVTQQNIDYTDFPLDEIKLYFIDGVILLPSEY